MENASKALIISGAVLIAIAIISIGVYIISSQKGVIDSNEKLGQTLEVKTFNSTFEKYEGSGKKGSEVKNLLIDIKTNNNMNSDKQISITHNSKTDINEIQKGIHPNKSYVITINGYENGYVKSILIQ